jgi:uncharacterized protein involved in cysteine biosynthesis
MFRWIQDIEITLPKEIGKIKMSGRSEVLIFSLILSLLGLILMLYRWFLEILRGNWGLYLPDLPSWIFWVGVLLFITGLLLFVALSLRQNPDKEDNQG